MSQNETFEDKVLKLQISFRKDILSTVAKSTCESTVTSCIGLTGLALLIHVNGWPLDQVVQDTLNAIPTVLPICFSGFTLFNLLKFSPRVWQLRELKNSAKSVGADFPFSFFVW
jgi:hypothetical protein